VKVCCHCSINWASLIRLKATYRGRPWSADVRAILESSDPRMLRELILLSWQSSDPGVKAILAYTLQLAWSGELDLAGEKDRAWITNYVNDADAEEFVKLIPARPISSSSGGGGRCLII
jgi:hypothetical protein